jgi:iron complex outermembrane recepter protein
VTPALTLGNGPAAGHTLAVSSQATNGSCTLTATDGTGRVRYQGNPNFTGADSCQITVSDADGDSAAATFAVIVNPVNETSGRVGGASAVDGWTLLLLALAGLRRRQRWLALLGGGVAAALSPLLAAAQEADSTGPKLNEIVVTSRKVQENLKDVPLSITAFDADTIAKAGITNLTDVAELTPGLSFFNAFGENLPVPVIRGVAPTDIFGAGNAAIFVDGVFISGREGLNFSQLDIERIEVVKGPQSAQYGRSAFSGALNYVTKAPSDEFEARALVEGGNDGKRRGLAMVSGPILGETLTGRISFLYDEWDGSYENPLSDVDVGGYRYRSWQGKLQWRPSDELKVSLSYYNSNDAVDDPATASLSANCEDRVGDGNSSVRLQNFCGEVPDLDDLPGQNGSDGIAKLAQAVGENRYLDRAILRADWTLPGVGTLTSLTGYSWTEQDSVSDFGRNLGLSQPFLYCEGLPSSLAAPNSCGANPADLRFFTGIYNPEFGATTEEWSQEIRFASDPDRRWRTVVGAFAYGTTIKDYPGNPVSALPLPSTPPGTAVGLAPFQGEAAIGTAIFYTTFTPDGGLDPLRRVETRNETSAFAIFGALDFDITDRLIARGEIRYAQDRNEFTAWRYQRCAPFTGDLDPLPATVCPDISVRPDDVFDLRTTAPVVTNRASARFNSTVGRFGLQYKLSDEWMLYGSVAEGDKPGGISFVELTVVTPEGPTQDRLAPDPFRTEKLTAWELGVKGYALDRRLSVDAAVFFSDWRDIVLRQLFETDPVSGLPLDQPAGFNENSGDAEVFGAELALAFAVTDGLTANTSLGWVDAELKNAKQENLSNFPTFAPDGDVSGNQLLRQPEWDASASLGYKHELVGEWDWFARGDVTYQSGVYVGNDNQGFLPERTYVNGRLGFRSPRYSIELWGRNLFNDTGAVAAFRDIYFGNTDNINPPFVNQGPRPDFDKFVPFRYTVSYPRERTYGLNLEVRFGGLAR